MRGRYERKSGPDAVRSFRALIEPRYEGGQCVLAREEAVGQAASATCDVDVLLEEAVEKHRHLLAGKPVEVVLDFEAHPCVAAQRTLLAVVLGNLVRNAFGYTAEGQVRLHLECGSLTVEDTGPGIPEEVRERVFEPHVSGPHSRGAGIGLALVRRICARYGWQMELASAEPRGTRARLLFPVGNPRVKSPS